MLRRAIPATRLEWHTFCYSVSRKRTARLNEHGHLLTRTRAALDGSPDACIGRARRERRRSVVARPEGGPRGTRRARERSPQRLLIERTPVAEATKGAMRASRFERTGPPCPPSSSRRAFFWP